MSWSFNEDPLSIGEESEDHCQPNPDDVRTDVVRQQTVEAKDVSGYEQSQNGDGQSNDVDQCIPQDSCRAFWPTVPVLERPSTVEDVREENSNRGCSNLCPKWLIYLKYSFPNNGE